MTADFQKSRNPENPISVNLFDLLEKIAVYRIGYRQNFENAGKLFSLRDISAIDGRLALCRSPDGRLRFQ